TDTPFNSIGKAGARFDSDAFALLMLTEEGARLTLACATPNSPAANPLGAAAGETLGDAVGDGLGLGLGVGVGVGLTPGLGVAVGLATGTGIKLAPVNIVIVAPVSEVIAGDNS